MSREKLVSKVLSANHTLSLLEIVRTSSDALSAEQVAARLKVQHSVSLQHVFAAIQRLVGLRVLENAASEMVLTEEYLEAINNGEAQFFLSKQIVVDLVSRIERSGLWGALSYQYAENVYRLDSMIMPATNDGVNLWVLGFGIAKRERIASRYWWIEESYNDLIRDSVTLLNGKSDRKKLSSEQLKCKLDQQLQDAEEVERWVVEYERARLSKCVMRSQIKQVSLDDVAAGYDVVSFEDDQSIRYDRFIEVKSYSGERKFYWSANEIRVAKEIGSQYFLYLVDRQRFRIAGYTPTIVSAPSIELFQSPESGWKVTVDSFMLKSVSG